ncbi:MAG: lipase family protein [Spirochaetaceae bacterium]|nr:MAG: lipase family protein [Spirochaetaceae bacterium]
MLMAAASCVVVPAPSQQTVMLGGSVTDSDLYRLFQMCRAAWRQRDEFLETGWQLEYRLDEATNTLVLLIEQDSTLYVIFRGSQVRRSDLDRSYNTMIARRRPGFGGLPRDVRTHIGFTTKYLGIRQTVLREVQRSSASRIVTVGHSAGGALALLAFVDLLDVEPQRLSHTVSFGAPRVFNRAGVSFLQPQQHRIVRVVNGADIVPRLPWRLFGYRHVGRQVDIDANGGVRIASQFDHDPGYEHSLRQRARAAGADQEFFSAFGH